VGIHIPSRLREGLGVGCAINATHHKKGGPQDRPFR
jgi:hypothetical protein